MAQLKTASETYVSSLVQAQAELDQLAHALEREFSERCSDSEANPLHILFRVDKLKRCADCEMERVGSEWMLEPRTAQAPSVREGLFAT
jgi:hypothetical protein